MAGVPCVSGCPAPTDNEPPRALRRNSGASGFVPPSRGKFPFALAACWSLLRVVLEPVAVVVLREIGREYRIGPTTSGEEASCVQTRSLACPHEVVGPIR